MHVLKMKYSYNKPGTGKLECWTVVIMVFRLICIMLGKLQVEAETMHGPYYQKDIVR